MITIAVTLLRGGSRMYFRAIVVNAVLVQILAS